MQTYASFRVPANVHGPFTRYKKEPTHGVRRADVKENQVLGQLKEAWSKFSSYGHPDKNNYSEAIVLIQFRYSAEDVEKFSIALAEFQEESGFSAKAGIFLSALINNGTDEDYIIHTNHLTQTINLLGYENTKNVIIDGNLGVFTFYKMKTGQVKVNGNVDNYIGKLMAGGQIIVNGNIDAWVGIEMSGGELIVNGNVRIWLGSDMSDGKIVVNGNVDICVGWCMTGGMIVINEEVNGGVGKAMNGGEIHLNGGHGDEQHGYWGIQYSYKGKIYEGGKLIV